jgi:hypothetical protein
MIDTGEDGTPPWLSDTEFLEKYRMHRESFHALVKKIKDHPVFKSRKGKTKQEPVEYQLMVFLMYIGTSGSGASNPRLRNAFGIGRGTSELYKRRVVKAIRSLRGGIIFWPDEAERKAIATRIRIKFEWYFCIAVADGTLFPLTYEPQSDDAPDYHGRKFAYSISTMIVNDDQKKIRYYLSGFPGCAHDNRVYSKTDLAQSPHLFFGDDYYLLADSAITNSPTVVSSYKCRRGEKLPRDQEMFNTHLGKLRVTSEHTIGMLKARFPFLRSIPMVVTKHKNSMRRILRVIDCCILLHNLLIDEHDDVPDEWYDDEDVIDDDGMQQEMDLLCHPIYEFHSNDTRRERCMNAFKNLGIVD